MIIKYESVNQHLVTDYHQVWRSSTLFIVNNSQVQYNIKQCTENMLEM